MSKCVCVAVNLFAAVDIALVFEFFGNCVVDLSGAVHVDGFEATLA